MDIREATPSDADAIRTIARDSLAASYSHFLDEETIDGAVSRWYADESLAEDLESDTALFVVGEADGEVVAFSQSDLVGEGQNIGRILWLHVHPDHRGGSSGVRLLVQTREKLLEAGAEDIRAMVLEDNQVGNEFYENNGFERAGTREVKIGDETYTENVFVDAGHEGGGDWRGIEPYELEDETIYISYDEASRGSKAPFYGAYRNEEGTERYAWFCGNCDSIDNAMDAMGRIECNVCGNRRKATRWDSSYL